MNMNHPQKIACLAGSGVGPELMAEAARVLSRLNELHSLAIDEVHVPFAGEAMTRFGHPLPLSTRAAYRKADAILVASPDEPAVEALMADLDLVWRVSRVHLGDAGEVVVFGAVDSASPREAVERAFFSAAAKHGRLTAVGSSPTWRRVVDAEHARWGGMLVERRTVGEALVRLRQARCDLDVIVTEAELFEPLTDAAAHLGGSPAGVADAWLAGEGPGLFMPGAPAPEDLAGFGLADPTAMLLTLSLLLAEGLHRRSAARTLERAVAAASTNGTVGTRSVTDAVLALLPEVRTDVEMFEEIWAA
jgi:3-isopropylmalate dehydrogenase